MRATASCEFKSIVSEFFTRDVKRYVHELTALGNEILPHALPAEDDFIIRLAQANARSLAACRELERRVGSDHDLILEAQARFRSEIQPWFDQSWFMERAKNKPRGYPGDYQTLIGIYEGIAKSSGLGGYLDQYFLHTPLAHAVRERLKATRTFLIDEVNRQRRPLTLVNVACGPCWEFTHNWPASAHPVRVKCLDMDREAIAYVDAQAGDLKPLGVQLETTVYNALRMSSVENNIKHFGKPDVIYSVGLCDYLPDNSMVRILRGWRESLAPGGIVYVAFKDCLQYDQTGYAWHVDWHFVPRTDEDCRGLFEKAGYDMEHVRMSRSESPVIMSYVCRNQEYGPLCAESKIANRSAVAGFVAG